MQPGPSDLVRTPGLERAYEDQKKSIFAIEK